MINIDEHRLFVLIILTALILASGWRTAKSTAQASSYFWQDGALLRTDDSRVGQGVPLTARLSCTATPPEVARFFDLPLPVNRADQYSLMALPGIGPKLAEKIIKFREGQGSIAGPDDLIKINGIGPKMTARLTPLLCFAPAQ